MEGIILGSIAFKENSKIIYLLTEEGKDSLLIRGAKKLGKNDVSYFQTLNQIEYEKKDKEGLQSPSKFDLTNDFQKIKDHPMKFTVASGIVEIINKHIADSDDFQTLYRLVIAFLHQLSEREDYLFLYLQMKIKMLYFLGINPNFKFCIHCNKKEDLYGLSLKMGSMECSEHRSDDNIGPVATKLIYLLYKDKNFETRIDDIENVKYLMSIVDQYYDYHIDLSLKSDAMLARLLV